MTAAPLGTPTTLHRRYGRVITVRGLSQGSITILAEPRDAYQRASTNDLQVRADKDIALGGKRRLRLGLDIFNIFNADTALTVANDSTQRFRSVRRKRSSCPVGRT